MIPLFKSHHSIGRSILTLAEAGKSEESQPDSILDIAVDNKLDGVFLVEDGMTGFMEAYTNFQKANIPLRYGLRITVCENMGKKNEESKETEHKVVIFLTAPEGYEPLITILSAAATDGFYYIPRVDCDTLKKLWPKKGLALAVPFYDSFLFHNTMSFATCVPDFGFTVPVFFLEDNALPFDFLIQEKVRAYTKANKFEIVEAQSVYYKTFKDFKAYLTFRCIQNRSCLEMPRLEFMGSNQFCFESFLEKNRGR